MIACLYERPQWTRNQVQQDDRIFLFGDNTKDRTETHYVPGFTQAVIRGLPNAIGIDTKRNRGTGSTSYMSDALYDWFVEHVDKQIDKAKSFNKTIVIPQNGIGTGKAALKQNAPRCYKYLCQKLNELLGYQRFA